jgi:hypothetical protein
MNGPTPWQKLGTKQDFINNRATREQLQDSNTLRDYQNLYDNRMNFFNEMVDEEQTQIDPITEEEITVTVQVPKVVAAIEGGITDAMHRVVNIGTEEEPVWVQQQKLLDPGSLLILKGFTEEEVAAILNS